MAAPPADARARQLLAGGSALGDLDCYYVSAARPSGGEPESVYLRTTADHQADASGVPVDLRGSGVLALPGGITAGFDIGLDLPRRDELELIGTNGVLRIPDPWIYRPRSLELVRGGRTQVVPIDRADGFARTGAETDAYRMSSTRCPARWPVAPLLPTPATTACARPGCSTRCGAPW